MSTVKTNIFSNTTDLLLHHGSSSDGLEVKHGVGDIRQDYGRAFYLTPDIEQAKIWSYAYNTAKVGYVYSYLLDISGLCVLDFTKISSYSHIATLLGNRTFSKLDFGDESRDLSVFLKKFYIDCSEWDLIYGWRSDDVFSNYMRKFISNQITFEQLSRIIKFGNLGYQYAAVSEEAINRLQLCNSAVVSSEYSGVFDRIGLNAEKDYKKTALEQPEESELYLIDIVRSIKRGDL